MIPVLIGTTIGVSGREETHAIPLREGDRQVRGPATAQIGSNHLHVEKYNIGSFPMNILDASEQGVRRTVQVQLKLQRRLQLLGD